MATIATAKGAFFDKKAVTDKVDAATRRNLQKSGGRLRLIAQRSMRYVSEPKKPGKLRRTSRPGSPPLAVRQHPWLRKRLFYYYDATTQSVIVGPVGFRSDTPVPGTLERGGRATFRNRRRVRRQVGDGGEIAIGLAGGRTSKLAKDTLLGTVPVTYARLRTSGQASRANRLNERLYGPAVIRRQIAPRPFMAPALATEARGMTKLWWMSVK